MQEKKYSGMRGLFLLVVGQTISLAGTVTAKFAIIFWVFQSTGKATTLAMMSTASALPAILLSPIAGVIVDRSNRKIAMMLSDFGAILSTIFIFTLIRLDMLDIWHLYLSGIIIGIFQSFQFPAYSSGLSLMIPKQHFARAHAMFSFAGAGANIIGPIFAAFLLNIISIDNILIIDIFTFLFAFSSLIIINIPQPKKIPESSFNLKTLIKESVFGITYIVKHKNLLMLILLFSSSVFFLNFGLILITPLVLKMTTNNEMTLGIVQSVNSIGALMGALYMSIFGTIEKKMNGIIIGTISIFIGMIIVGLGQNLLFWCTGGFIITLFMPIVTALDQAIWQTKIDPSIQGKVFSFRRLIGLSSRPIAFIIAGPLADNIFEPAFGKYGTFNLLLFSNQSGSGISILVLLCGILGCLFTLFFYTLPNLRNIEIILDDAI